MSLRQTDLSVDERQIAVMAIACCSKRKPNNLHCPIHLRKSNRRVEEDSKISLMKIICC